jgi:poly-gamma-glutamate capsule biosynthesis protein CapA/YwtB (metallophosphatase superfamily)
MLLMRRRIMVSIFAGFVIGGAVAAAYLLWTADDDNGRVAVGGATTEPGLAAAATVSTTAAATTTTVSRRGSGQPVTIAFAGDIHFEGVLRNKLAANPSTVLAPIAPLLGSADLTVANLETAVTDRGTPAPKEFTFRAPATALTALAAGGIDVASMANNHGMDYGPVGLQDSLAARNSSGFPIMGIGNNATEAFAPYRTTIKGQRVAVIGATQVLDANLISSWTATDAQAGLASAKDVPRLVAAVQAARADSDTVVVFLHWGVETHTCPSADQQQLARTLVDAGADIVIGGHAHRLQGGGRMDAAFVGYGLGNFAFYAKPGPGAQSGIVFVTATGRDIDSYQFAPAVISNGVPQPLGGDAATNAVAAWNNLRGCTGLAP